MTSAWRILFYAALAAIIGPAVCALALIGLGAAQGCAMDAASCTALGPALSGALSWAWDRVFDVYLTGALVLAAAIGAGLSFRPARYAALVGGLAICWFAVAALILPYVAVFAAQPAACNVNGPGPQGCLLWGADMVSPFAAPLVAMWFAPHTLSLALGGVLLTWLIARWRDKSRPGPG